MCDTLVQGSDIPCGRGWPNPYMYLSIRLRIILWVAILFDESFGGVNRWYAVVEWDAISSHAVQIGRLMLIGTKARHSRLTSRVDGIDENSTPIECFLSSTVAVGRFRRADGMMERCPSGSR